MKNSRQSLSSSIILGKSWGERLLAALSISLFVQLVIGWVRQYENPEANASLLYVISFRVIDPPWMPVDVNPSRDLMGLHHFGDLMLAMGYGLTANPYLSEYPSQTPPLGILIFRLIARFGYENGLWIFLVITLTPMIIAGWLILEKWSVSQKLIFLVFTSLITLGTVTNLDRGSLSFAGIGLTAMAFVLANKQKYVFSSLFLILAISLKPYLAILLLYPLLKGAWKFALGTGLATLIINLLIMTSFRWGFEKSFIGFLHGISRYSGDTGKYADVTLGSSGLFGAANRFIALFIGPQNAVEFMRSLLPFALLMGGLWLLVTLFFVIAPGIPHWVKLPLILSTTMMVIPSSMIYTVSWASLGALYFVATNNVDPWPIKQQSVLWKIPLMSKITIRQKLTPTARWLVLIPIAVNLVPWLATRITQDGVVDPFAYFLPAWSLFICTLLLFFTITISNLGSIVKVKINDEL